VAYVGGAAVPGRRSAFVLLGRFRDTFAGHLLRCGALMAFLVALVLAVTGAAQSAAAPLMAPGGPGAGPPKAAVPWPGAGTAVTAGPGRPPAVPQLWRWPLLPKPRVLRAFDAPAKPWLPGHRGVDLAAVPGQPVLSPATGVVVFAGVLAGRGVLSIEYGGIRSSFEPVVPLVKPGDAVVVGEPVALLAPAPLHCRTRPCLHWGAFQSLSVPRHYLDPRLLVGAGPVRLLPDRVGQLPARLLPGPGAARGPATGSGRGSGPPAPKPQPPSQVPAWPEPTASAPTDTGQPGVTTAGIALIGGLVAGGGLHTTRAYRRAGHLSARRGRGHHGPGRGR